MTIKAGGTTRVSCESRGGNPAAVLKWFIDDEEVKGRMDRSLIVDIIDELIMLLSARLSAHYVVKSIDFTP